MKIRIYKQGAICSLAVLLGLVAAGCGGQNPASQPPAQTQGQARRYALRGTVLSIDRPEQRIMVDHEEIEGFMAAMAMPYPVTDPELLDVVGPGDQITAEVVVTDTSAHLENIVVVKKAEPKPGGSLRERMPGETTPKFEFAQDNGKQLRLLPYQGRTALLV